MIVYKDAQLDSSHTFHAVFTEVKAGHTVAYYGTHQAWFPNTVVVKDSANHEYSRKTVTGSHAEEVDHKIFQMANPTLAFDVTFDARCRLIKYCIISEDIHTEDQSRVVGRHYSYCFEDSTDDDYNDLVLSFTICFKGMELS